MSLVKRNVITIVTLAVLAATTFSPGLADGYPQPVQHRLSQAEYAGRPAPSQHNSPFQYTGSRSVDDVYWWEGFRLPGANDVIHDAILYKGDLVVVGAFSWIGETSASCIARWDGIRWHPLGTGLFWEDWGSPTGLSLAVYDGLLIVGGQFVSAGGAWSESIAAWDGETWSGLDGGLLSTYGENYPSYVHDLLSVGDYLYATGWFWEASGRSVKGVARWDGAEWHPVGVGVYGTGTDLTAWQGGIVVSGSFEALGDGTPVGYLAHWDGLEWQTLAGGLDDRAYAVTTYGAALIAAGRFGSAGGVPAARIASWDGMGWTELGGGLDDSAHAMTVLGGELFVGGHFTLAGGTSVDKFVSWDGVDWENIGTSSEGLIYDLLPTPEGLLATGTFTHIGGHSAARIALWDGADWLTVGIEGDGFEPTYESKIKALTVYENQLVVGGSFDLASGLPARSVAVWDGQNFTEVGGGLDSNGYIDALCVHGGKLVVSGGIWAAGGVPVSHIAAWDGASWDDMAGGIDSRAVALTVFNNELIVGGWLELAGGVPVQSIAAWDGASWSALGSGQSCTVYALTVYGGNLIAGGCSDYLWSWDGTEWTNFGAHYGTVYALSEHRGRLVVGGLFSEMNGIPTSCAAAWDGNAWQALGDGLDWTVRALASDGQHLVAGGLFTESGGGPVAHVANWDGQAWQALGSGIDDSVLALRFLDGKLYAGGDFMLAGGKSSGAVARWDGFNPTAIDEPSLLTPAEWKSVNVPNPFNPSTEIRFSLPTTAKTFLRIYDASGREVCCLLDGSHCGSGEVRLTWNGRDDTGQPLPSGVYFYEVEAGEFRATRKMMLLK